MLSLYFLLALGCGSDNSSVPHSVPPPTGSGVGKKIPPFRALDQFGHEVSDDTLRASNGTVLLFFRSADW